jgi:hypothetical protein
MVGCMRVTAALFTLLLLSGGAALIHAAPGDTPIPLQPATGYRDYCDAMSLHRQRLVCGTGRVPLAFWRALKLPMVGAGQACPASRLHKISGSMRGVGPGPVYSTHVIPWVVLFPPPENSIAAGTGWSVDKTPLVWRKHFRGSFLIRGARIDGEGELGFSGPGGRPFAAMQFAAGRAGLEVAGLHGWPVLVWMTTPGCYAFQIDGKTFSRVVVFRVSLEAR